MAESYLGTDGEHHTLYVAERGAHPGPCREPGCPEPQVYGYGGFCWRHWGREDTRTQAEYHADQQRVREVLKWGRRD